ncbi:recombination protein RecR [Halomonas sp. ISL-60]|uniref:recombination mediator RecR n=1 Tax=unclassified Halomonas TaxID=2609666 RepID=UPI0007D9305C|nr:MULTISPECIES: recombination mediator RecR [unclassified Halomonas]MBT2770747.1 recombination protein RecR [Halomonas sp. ISL-60]MBT2788806.1 recombination protein RecR [Halomonas sp. ISL-106]MBT2799525.1 recombination protein RecR [Halomonas sp. ISL-104]MBT2803889.1 recombination protein RecR [Halomonas sp. ISL-56]OAL60439.1 recombination protein RecR [Halomonas sp. ALS9]
MRFSPLVEQLMDAFRILPGVGPKTAQRMAMHLLERERPGGQRLAAIIQQAIEEVGYCQRCRTLTEADICMLCESPRRDDALLCVVESPADQLAIEEAGGFKGRYFVLHGHLSPLDGVGPESIGLDLLEARVAEGLIEEVVLATNPTIEGEATAHYIAALLSEHGVKLSRLAYGVPMGGELEYVDGGTLSRAFNGRLPFASE